VYLEEGDVVKKDASKSFIYYKKAGTGGSSQACLRVALCYFFGTLGTPVNFKEGLNWLKMATNKGDRKSVEAMHTLGLLYSGEMPNVQPPPSFQITPDTIAEAGELFLKSAKLGFVASMKKLAEGFEKGVYGFTRSREQAIYWYKLAAEVDPESGLALAALYYEWGMEGTLEPGRAEEAFALADRAAQMGIAAGQFAVGYFYEKGFGVHEDMSISRQWYEVAAKNGDERAIERIYPDGQVPTLARKDNNKDACIIS
jgi:TPR repeat protein